MTWTDLESVTHDVSVQIEDIVGHVATNARRPKATCLGMRCGLIVPASFDVSDGVVDCMTCLARRTHGRGGAAEENE